jgi:ferredoxin
MLHKEKRAVASPVRVVIDPQLCHSCGACVAVCPPDSLFLTNVHLKVDHNTCTVCERCIRVCPVHAISLTKDFNGK